MTMTPDYEFDEDGDPFATSEPEQLTQPTASAVDDAFRVFEVRAENFRMLKAVCIKPDPTEPIVMISGKNGAGKSSIIDAIWCSLLGARSFPDRPVRAGETQADTFVDFGKIKVYRSYSTTGKPVLKVVASDGKTIKSAQGVLDEFVGEMCSDPTAFYNANEKDQVDMVLQKCPLSIDLDELAAERDFAYKSRHEFGQQLRSAEGALETLVDLPEIAPEMVDIEAVITERRAREVHAKKRIEAERGVERQLADIKASTRRADELQAQIDALIAQRDEARLKSEQLIEVRGKAVDALNLIPIVTFDDVDEKLSAAEATNTTARKCAERDGYMKFTAEMKTEIATLTAEIDEIDKKKKTALATAVLPVEGLVFAEGPKGLSLLYHGMTLKDCSSGERITVSVGLAMAENPPLRLMPMRNANMLDDDNMAIVRQMAITNDFQVFVEVVDKSGSGEVGIYIEDGEVARINN